jgi:excisionase family DNA binding protein
VTLVSGRSGVHRSANNTLNTGRPFLISLLNMGEIESEMVGRHRRIKAEILFAGGPQDVSDNLMGVNQSSTGQLGRSRYTVLQQRQPL